MNRSLKLQPIMHSLYGLGIKKGLSKWVYVEYDEFSMCERDGFSSLLIIAHARFGVICFRPGNFNTKITRDNIYRIYSIVCVCVFFHTHKKKNNKILDIYRRVQGTLYENHWNSIEKKGTHNRTTKYKTKGVHSRRCTIELRSFNLELGVEA